MATTVRYNGVLLRNVVTRKWDQTITYDESGTDVMYQRFSFTFEGILHSQDQEDAPAAIYPQDSPDGSVSLTYGQISRRLGESRKTLDIWMGPSNRLENSFRVFSSRPYDNLSIEGQDVDNGPKPSEVNITHIAGNKVFRIVFSIDVTLVACVSGAAASVVGPVLSNRWRVSEVMDGNFFTTRTITGTMRVAANHPEVNALSMRHVVVPPLEDGFKREGMTYGVTKDGLTVEYEIRDRQVHTSAPWPATEMSGTHTESTSGGTVFAAEVSVRLVGPPAASKADLIQRLVQIIDARLDIIRHANLPQGEAAPFFLKQSALIDHFGEQNIVEMRVSIQRSPKFIGESGSSATQILHEQLTNVIATTMARRMILPAIAGSGVYDPRISRLPHVFGYHPQTGERDPTVALYFLQCYLQGPCDGEHHIADAFQEVSDEEDHDETFPIEAGLIDKSLPLSQTSGNYSDDTAEAFYTYYELKNTYTTRHIRVQAPLALSSDANDTDDTSQIFTLASGQAVREMRLEAERVGKEPQIPEPLDEFKDGELTGTLIKHEEHIFPPTLSADGRTNLYRTEAYYRWAMNRPPTKDEETRIGVLPFTDYDQEFTSITRSDMYDERLEA